MLRTRNEIVNKTYKMPSAVYVPDSHSKKILKVKNISNTLAPTKSILMSTSEIILSKKSS